MSVYIDLPGGYVAEPPFQHEGVVLHSFFIRGDRAQIQAQLDASLNRVPGMRFEAVTDLVLVAALYVDRATSLASGWRDGGISTETDIGFWVLTRGGRGGQQQFRWWPVYLFVDQAPALTAGREIYGFPKYLGRIARPANPRSDVGVAVNALFFRTSSATARPVQADLIRINHDRGFLGNIFPAVGVKMAMDQAVLEVSTGALVAGGDGPPVGLPYLKMPMLFLKQFRDIAQPGNACYQSLVALEVQGRAESIGVLPGKAEVVLTPSSSLPIARDLGLAERNSSVSPLVCIEMSFTAGPGYEL